MAKEVWADKIEECYRRAADARRLSEAAADPSTNLEFHLLPEPFPISRSRIVLKEG
jgi:hypothetical protein